MGKGKRKKQKCETIGCSHRGGDCGKNYMEFRNWGFKLLVVFFGSVFLAMTFSLVWVFGPIWIPLFTGALIGLTYASKYYTGAFFNPLTTLASMINDCKRLGRTRREVWGMGGLYIAAQTLGAGLGLIIISTVFTTGIPTLEALDLVNYPQAPIAIFLHFFFGGVYVLVYLSTRKTRGGVYKAMLFFMSVASTVVYFYSSGGGGLFVTSISVVANFLGSLPFLYSSWNPAALSSGIALLIIDMLNAGIWGLVYKYFTRFYKRKGYSKWH